MPETHAHFNPSFHNQPAYSVSEVAGSIKRMVEDLFGHIRVRGEISGWKQAASGHVYFRLKDDNAVLDAVCWRGIASRFSFKPEDGLEVIASGKVTTYPGRSSYQIVIDSLEPAGVGALMALLEQRKKKLEAEGLFAATRKRSLPFLPRTVGIVTSPTGAVIRDILHRLGERFPVRVLLWPVMVQGEGAAQQIAAAIEGFNTLPSKPDLLIVARGGGSIEDLWAFNEEIVVRAAAASDIPLISAVGHETDTTLIDYASDKRAPTPTAAAEMAVPVREELRLGVTQLGARLEAGALRLLQQREETLKGLARGLPRPQETLGACAQRLDDWSERLAASLPALLALKERHLALALAALKPRILYQDVQKTQQRIEDLAIQFTQACIRLCDRKRERLDLLGAMLDALDYRRVLERGFALVKNNQGGLISSAEQAADTHDLRIVFKDGEVSARLRAG